MLHGLDLFSGIAGIGLALAPWVRTVAYCEADRYAQAVLLSRMESGDIDCGPIWDDVRTLRGDMLPGIDIIFGGFPCQDISTAGRGAGLEGERSGLFFEIMRLVDELRPRFIFLENVAAITVRGLGTVTAEIACRGYDCRWTTLSAAEVGANHERARWWLLAHANDTQCQGKRLSSGLQQENAGIRSNGEIISDSMRERLQESGQDGRSGSTTASTNRETNIASDASWWESEPDVGRVVNGLPYRVDRIKCLGNSVVPLCAREAFKELMGVK